MACLFKHFLYSFSTCTYAWYPVATSSCSCDNVATLQLLITYKSALEIKSQVLKLHWYY